MTATNNALAHVLIVSLLLLLGNGGAAAVVRIDLLGGIGDLEYCADTSWNVYGHPDYDFDLSLIHI